MADFDQREFDESLDKFYRKLASLSESVGRGGQGKGSGSPVPGAKASTPEQKAQKENRLETDKSTKSIKAQRVQTDAEIKASKEAVDAQEDLTKSQEDGYRAQKDTTRAFKRFGETLISENSNLSSAFGNLSSNLGSTGTAFGRVAGGIAAGIGYMIGGLQEFAKNAGDMGAFADLNKFSVGSVTQMKVMSGLGNSFIKVIDESQGRFKAFGSNSQEAAENLSNLSRGLKYGSFYLNSTLKKSLGTDLVKSVNKASNAAAAMGLNDEERAKLMGSIAQSSSLGAKDEQDAQQRLVRQYANTLDNTRKLSNAFGVSSKEILASMDAFRKSQAGTYASLEGNEGAANIVGLIKEMGIENDPEKISRMALALSRGDEGAAVANLSNGANAQGFDMLATAIRNGGEGGNNVDGMMSNLKGMIPDMDRIRDERSQLATTNPEYAQLGASLGKFSKNLQQGDKDKDKPEPKTSEASNIQSMNSLTAALESLRNVIIGLTAGLATLVGSLGAIAVAGGIGGLMSGKVGSVIGGVMGKAGDMLGGILGKKSVGPAAGSMTGWQSGPTASAGRLVTDKMGGGFAGGVSSAAGGVMDKLSGAAGKGMEGFGNMLGKLGDSKTVKGAGTLALLGSALALAAVGFKTFNEVNWPSLVKGTVALGALVAMARIVGEATTGIIKGAGAIAILGAAVTLSAVGFKTFNDVSWESLIKGAGAIAILGVSAQLLGKMTSSILIGAVGIAALGAAMWVAGKGFASFNDVEWDSVAKGAVALAALGVVAVGLGVVAPALLFGSLAIAALGASMWVAAKGFASFNEVEWDSTMKGAVALAALGVVAVGLGIVSPLLLLGSIAIAALGAAMWVAGKGFASFNDVDWASTTKGSIALAALGVVAVGLGIVSPLLLLGSVAIAALGAAMWVAGQGFASFNAVDWGSTVKGAVAIGVLGVALVALSPALAIMAIASIPLIAFGAGLAIFAMGVKQFNEVNWDSIPKALTALVGLAFGILLISPALAIMAIASIPLLAFGAALSMFAVGVGMFNDVDWGSTFKGALAIGVLGIAIAGIGLLAPGIIVGSIALGIMAIAVGALGVAMIPAAYATQMFADALKTIGDIDGGNLIAIGAGLAAIGAGAVIFAAGMIAATAGSVITGIMSLFGAESPLERVMEFVPYADAISALGEGMLNFGTGIGLINDNLKALDLDALEKFKNVLIDMSNIDLPSLDGLSIPQLSTDNMANPQSQGTVLADSLNGNTAVTPEVISQVIAYLSSIENDLAAIRGNTKQNGSESTVRLS